MLLRIQGVSAATRALALGHRQLQSLPDPPIAIGDSVEQSDRLFSHRRSGVNLGVDAIGKVNRG